MQITDIIGLLTITGIILLGILIITLVRRSAQNKAGTRRWTKEEIRVRKAMNDYSVYKDYINARMREFDKIRKTNKIVSTDFVHYYGLGSEVNKIDLGDSLDLSTHLLKNKRKFRVLSVGAFDSVDGEDSTTRAIIRECSNRNNEIVIISLVETIGLASLSKKRIVRACFNGDGINKVVIASRHETDCLEMVKYAREISNEQNK